MDIFYKKFFKDLEYNSLKCPVFKVSDADSNISVAFNSLHGAESSLTSLQSLRQSSDSLIFYGTRKFIKVQRWATGWTIGVLGFDSRRGLGIFLFTTASRTTLGPTQPPIQWVPRALPWGQRDRGVKLTTQLHLVPRSKNEWSYTFTPPIRFHGVVLS
jgi:hypothetical protein